MLILEMSELEAFKLNHGAWPSGTNSESKKVMFTWQQHIDR